MINLTGWLPQPHGTSNSAGAAFEVAEWASIQISSLGIEYEFVPFGVKTLGSWSYSAKNTKNYLNG